MAEPVAWDAPPMPAHPLVGVTAFTMKRRVTRREQYCEFRPLGPDGVEGDVALYATQRQFRLREEYLFSTDREHTRPFMIVRARAGLNIINAGFDVYDERGAPIGWFQYLWMESQVMHSWRLVGQGADLRGVQHSVLGGMLRVRLNRLPFGGLVPLRRGFDFRFRDATGTVRLQVARRPQSRDRYTATVLGGSVDTRLAAGMAFVLDWRVVN